MTKQQARRLQNGDEIMWKHRQEVCRVIGEPREEERFVFVPIVTPDGAFVTLTHGEIS